MFNFSPSLKIVHSAVIAIITDFLSDNSIFWLADNPFMADFIETVRFFLINFALGWGSGVPPIRLLSGKIAKMLD